MAISIFSGSHLTILPRFAYHIESLDNSIYHILELSKNISYSILITNQRLPCITFFGSKTISLTQFWEPIICNNVLCYYKSSLSFENQLEDVIHHTLIIPLLLDFENHSHTTMCHSLGLSKPLLHSSKDQLNGVICCSIKISKELSS